MDGKWHGYNTDGFGALNALEAEGRVAGKRVVIVGAGGAAKAIAYEAYRRGAHVIVCNRDKQKAERLAEKVHGTSFGLDEIPQNYDILINCTPSLMPIDAKDILQTAIIMDIHTRPKVTELLQKSSHVVYGYKMFVEQAVGQYAIWFAGGIDLNCCRRVLEQAAVEIL